MSESDVKTIEIKDDFDPHQFDRFSQADRQLFNEMREISKKLRKKGLLPPPKELK